MADRTWRLIVLALAVALIVAVVIGATRSSGGPNASKTCHDMQAAAQSSMKEAQDIYDRAVLDSVKSHDEDFVDQLRDECGARFVDAVDNA